MNNKEYFKKEMLKSLGLTEEQWSGNIPVSPLKTSSGYEIDQNIYHSEDFNFWWSRGNKFALTKDSQNIIYCSSVCIGRNYYISANSFFPDITVRMRFSGARTTEFNQNDVLNQDNVIEFKKILANKKDDSECIKLIKSILSREFRL